jgi:hypothetical protein
MAYVATDATVLLFGGRDSNGMALGDTWAWNGTTWTLQAPASSPGARAGAGFASDSVNGNAVLFGGINGSTVYGDTWNWTGKGWFAVQSGSGPISRSDAAMTFDTAHSEFILNGGATCCQGSASDTWTLTIQ